MHEKPFLPGERYSISREMERNVKGYKVIIIMVMIMIRGMMVIILLIIIITKGSSRLMMIKMMIFILLILTKISGGSPRLDRGPGIGRQAEERPAVDGQVLSSVLYLLSIN